MNKSKALLIADQRSFRNTEMINLLIRSGFEVDIITQYRFHYLYTNINKLFFYKNIYQFTRLASELVGKYEFVALLGDVALKLIKDSALRVDEKLALMPVCSQDAIQHICSKIALSNTLSIAGISTPPYKILSNWISLADEVKDIGYPALLKIDYSGGGSGTYRLDSALDIKQIPLNFKGQPVLIQKYIKGKLLDLSAFFQNTELVYFSCSIVESTVDGPFGPSKQRSYYTLESISKDIFEELASLGIALSAHGFCNIACIQCAESGKRYYFEADMRPNDWVNYAKYIDDDPAKRIREYFEQRNTLNVSEIGIRHSLNKRYFVNPARMGMVELLFNRYDWISHANLSSLIMHKLSILFFNPWEKFKILAVRHIKPKVSDRTWSVIKLKF